MIRLSTHLFEAHERAARCARGRIRTRFCGPHARPLFLYVRAAEHVLTGARNAHHSCRVSKKSGSARDPSSSGLCRRACFRSSGGLAFARVLYIHGGVEDTAHLIACTPTSAAPEPVLERPTSRFTAFSAGFNPTTANASGAAVLADIRPRASRLPRPADPAGHGPEDVISSFCGSEVCESAFADPRQNLARAPCRDLVSLSTGSEPISVVSSLLDRAPAGVEGPSRRADAMMVVAGPGSLRLSLPAGPPQQRRSAPLGTSATQSTRSRLETLSLRFAESAPQVDIDPVPPRSFAVYGRADQAESAQLSHLIYFRPAHGMGRSSRFRHRRTALPTKSIAQAGFHPPRHHRRAYSRIKTPNEGRQLRPECLYR